MDFIADYVRTLAFFMIFAALVEIIAPSGSFKKYIRLVLSLVFLAMLIEPAAIAINNFSFEDNYIRLQSEIDSSAINKERKRLEEEQAEMIINQYSAELKAGMTEIAEEASGASVRSVRVVVNPDMEDLGFGEILGVHIEASSSYSDKNESGSGRARKALLGNALSEPENNGGEAIEQIIKSSISDFYNVPKDNIHITVLNE